MWNRQFATSAMLLVCFTWMTPAIASDWPEFRGPNGQGHATAASLPIEWSSTKNIAWKKPIPGRGWSSPILVQGKIILTTAVPDGNQQSLRVICLDQATGNRLWNVEVFRHATVRIHRKNSHASPTPLSDGERIYVHFGTHGTAALDFKGEVLWRNKELKYRPVHGSGGSPILVDEKLILSCDGGDVQFVVALDRRTGRIRWKTPRPQTKAAKKFAFSTPLAINVNEEVQVVSVGANHVAAYDPDDGREIWRVFHGGYSNVPRPVYGHGLIFIGTGYDAPKIFAIRPTGKGDVTKTHVAWKLSRSAPLNPSFLLIGQELYTVSDRGIAQCVNARTGEVYWRERLGGAFSASPIFADGKIYFLSERGITTVIAPGTKYVQIARNDLGEISLASIAAVGKALFMRTDENLYRIQKK